MALGTRMMAQRRRTLEREMVMTKKEGGAEVALHLTHTLRADVVAEILTKSEILVFFPFTLEKKIDMFTIVLIQRILGILYPTVSCSNKRLISGGGLRALS